MLDTVVFINPIVIDFFTNEMLLVKIHAEQDTLTKQRYSVMGYPTSVLVDKSGEEVDRLVGFAEPEEYIKTFRDYTTGIGTLAFMLRDFEGSVNRELALDIADKYKYRGMVPEAEEWYAKTMEMGTPNDSLSGFVMISLGDMYMRVKNYSLAHQVFAETVKDYAGTPFAMEAEIYQAIVYRRENDTTNAIAAFEQFIRNWPESEDIEYAKEQIAKLKGEDEKK